MGKYINAAIDVETTGLVAGKHEIVEICVLLHDDDFHPIDRFVSKIRPLRPDLADPKAMEVNGLSLTALKGEATPSQVRNALNQWHEEVCDNKKIIPLGQNYAFDKGFLELFLGKETFYPSMFHYHYRDTMLLAKGLQDSGLLRLDYINLKSMCKHFNVRCDSHTAYGDASATLQIYRKLLDMIRSK